MKETRMGALAALGVVAAATACTSSVSGVSGVGAAEASAEVRGTAASTGSDGAGGSRERWATGYAAAEENGGADCAVAELPDAAQLPERPLLPDPFQRLDGTRMTRRSEWRCRRQEILRQAEKYIYGHKPTRPAKVNGTVTEDTIAVDVEHQGKAIHFTAEVVLPPRGQRPFPAIINLGARSGFGGMRLGEDLIVEQGVAIIYYNHNEIGREGKPEASRGLPNPGLFYDLYGGDHSAGLLMAWAWGVSRVLDVLQDSRSNVIDAGRVGVTGCSRNGKGALAVGAFDERIALTIPQETSTGGLPAYRIVDATSGAERTNHNFYGLNWLGNGFQPFVEHATRLPIDSHEVVALVAPRGLLVLDNPHIAQFAAVAAHPAVVAGRAVYEALGAPANVSYISDVADEKHCAAGKPEYTAAIIQNIESFLKRERPAAGTIAVSPKATGPLEQWIDWQTPALRDDHVH